MLRKVPNEICEISLRGPQRLYFEEAIWNGKQTDIEKSKEKKRGFACNPCITVELLTPDVSARLYWLRHGILEASGLTVFNENGY